MEQVGKVLSVNEDMVKLEVKRISACGTNCKNCAASCEIKSEIISLPNTIKAKTGDYVELKSETDKVISFISLIYGVPLLFFLAGVLISYYSLEKLQVKNYEILSFISGIIFTTISYLIIRHIDKKSGASKQVHIRMIRIISS